MNKNPKIFIAEDEETLAEISRIRFEKAGFLVTICKNGLQLLEKLSMETPNVILLDINMPEMNGYEVLDTIHKNFVDQHKMDVPVIIWSNITESSDVERVLKLGATAYLRKVEYSEGNLVDKVLEIMSTKR